jgi:hypothetical protein
MPEATIDQTGNGARNTARDRLTAFQARLDAFEQEARGRLSRAIGASNEALHDLDEALARVSREDWTVPALRKRLDELRARAEDLRASALKRVAGMPGTAVSAIATSSRVPVQNLAKGLERIAKRLDPPVPPKQE